jgi:TRAP-type C4-dicarboxylate transport system permease large subunit
LTNYLINEEIPMKMFSLVKSQITSPFAFLIVLNLFLLVVGCLMDIFSAMTVVIPLITPIASAYGIDPVHLGIIFLTNLEIGAQTPPVGVNLFISSLRFEKPVLKIVLASLPFITLLLFALAIITYVPWLSLALVK